MQIHTHNEFLGELRELRPWIDNIRNHSDFGQDRDFWYGSGFKQTWNEANEVFRWVMHGDGDERFSHTYVDDAYVEVRDRNTLVPMERYLLRP